MSDRIEDVLRRDSERISVKPQIGRFHERREARRRAKQLRRRAGMAAAVLCVSLGTAVALVQASGISGPSADRVDTGSALSAPDLFVATRQGHTEAIRSHVSHGGSLELSEIGGFTPVMVAAVRGDSATVTALIELGADPLACSDSGESSVDLAAERGHLETVEVLLDAGVPVDSRGCDRSARTPLMDAAVADRPAIVRLLVAEGADVNATSTEGLSALALAIREAPPGRADERLADLVGVLLDAGADPSRNNGAVDLAQFVAERGLSKTERLLVEASPPAD